MFMMELIARISTVPSEASNSVYSTGMHEEFRFAIFPDSCFASRIDVRVTSDVLEHSFKSKELGTIRKKFEEIVDSSKR